MAKPLDEFGGWLRFFHVLTALNLVVTALLLGAAIYFLISGAPKPGITFGHQITTIAIAIPFASLLATLWMKLPVKDRSTPRTLFRCTYAAISLVFLSALLDAAVTAAAVEDVSFFNAFEWPRGIIWLLVFAIYLERSKRVKAFYGMNYPDRDANAPEYLADPVGEMVEGWKNRPGQKK